MAHEYAFANAPVAPALTFEQVRDHPSTDKLIRCFGRGQEQVAGIGEQGLLFWLKGEEITRVLSAFRGPLGSIVDSSGGS